MSIKPPAFISNRVQSFRVLGVDCVAGGIKVSNSNGVISFCIDFRVSLEDVRSGQCVIEKSLCEEAASYIFSSNSLNFINNIKIDDYRADITEYWVLVQVSGVIVPLYIPAVGSPLIPSYDRWPESGASPSKPKPTEAVEAAPHKRVFRPE